MTIKNIEDLFTYVYKNNSWGDEESTSGSGSNTTQTKTVIDELPILLEKFNISTMLDAPCGDFTWMQHVDLSKVNYTGFDIVKELIQKNVKNHAKENIRFQYSNLLTDPLPTSDLVFCRDCLVHFSYMHIYMILSNIIKSQSKYFITTTFTNSNIRIGSQWKDNIDITTGQWRPLNLETKPFLFPPPLAILNENCTEFNGLAKDKSLGIWKVDSIRQSPIILKGDEMLKNKNQ